MKQEISIGRLVEAHTLIRYSESVCGECHGDSLKSNILPNFVSNNTKSKDRESIYSKALCIKHFRNNSNFIVPELTPRENICCPGRNTVTVPSRFCVWLSLTWAFPHTIVLIALLLSPSKVVSDRISGQSYLKCCITIAIRFDFWKNLSIFRVCLAHYI